MHDISPELLLESFAEALQTAAFASLDPPPEPLVPPVDAEQYSLDFHGRISGTLHLAASRTLGQVLAANILTTDATAQEALARAHDVLKELCNITTGLMLRHLGEETCRDIDIGITQVQPLAGPGEWRNFADQPGAVFASAEGFPLILLLKEAV